MRESVLNKKLEAWEIEERLRFYLTAKQHRFVLKNFYIRHWECDVFSVSAHGVTNEYEVKVTLADYKRDQRKNCGDENKHALIQEGKRVNKFWYVIPSTWSVEVPEYAGVLHYWQDDNDSHIHIRKIKEAKMLHNGKLSEDIKLLYNIALKCYYRMLSLQGKK
jgi:hypothetical protein